MKVQETDNTQRNSEGNTVAREGEEQISGFGAGTIAWQRFNIAYEYPVVFTEHLFDTRNNTLVNTLSRPEPEKRHRIVCFIDEGVAGAIPNLIDDIKAYVEYHKEHITLATEPVVFPAGEKIKSELHFVEQMQRVLSDERIDRHSYVVGIGGGALLDTVGLVAATSHRGIRHIRVPTTVLAQNDSGVGVKNGVNLFGQKNYIGTFAPPFAVLNDYEFIRYLPERDKIAGMAEAVKVALIRDSEFYQWLENNTNALAGFEGDAMRYMIKRCAELHMHQIANGGDPFEVGSARPLDYGHWSAHRLETLTRYHLRHGEAVAIGLALDTRYSVLCGLLEAGSDVRVCDLLERLGFRLWHPALEGRDKQHRHQVLQGLIDFREHLGGELTITLLEALGKGIEVHKMDEQLILQSIEWLKTRDQN